MRDFKPYLVHILEECEYLENASENLNYVEINQKFFLSFLFFPFS